MKITYVVNVENNVVKCNEMAVQQYCIDCVKTSIW